MDPGTLVHFYIVAFIVALAATTAIGLAFARSGH